MSLSLPVVALLTLGLILGSIYAGNSLFRLVKRSRPDTVIEPSGTAVGALMGLLAFMLAFTFGMGSSKLNDRKQALLQEINAVGTLFLRADLLPEDKKVATRDLLREYVKIRVDLQRNEGTVAEALNRSDEICNALWAIAAESANLNKGPVEALVVDATNDVIDTYEERVFHGLQHLPIVIWASLISMSILAMLAMGYQLGLSGKMSHIVNILVALTFAGALMLIADYDSYDAGFFQIPKAPMERLYQSIQ